MSGSDATDGAGSAAAERPQHTPTPRAGQVARQKDLFGHLWGRHHRHDTGLHSCRPALATTADVNSGHFVVQDANSVCPPSRRCRPKPAVGGWCAPTPRPLDMEIPLIVVVMTPRSTRDGLGIGIAGDGDTPGQRHLEWGTNTGVGGGPVTNTRARTDRLKPPRLRWHRLRRPPRPGHRCGQRHRPGDRDPVRRRGSPHRSVRRQVAAPRDLHPGSAKAGLSGRRRRCHPGGARRPEPSPQVDDRADNRSRTLGVSRRSLALAFTPDGPGPESGRGPSPSPDRGLGR